MADTVGSNESLGQKEVDLIVEQNRPPGLTDEAWGVMAERCKTNMDSISLTTQSDREAMNKGIMYGAIAGAMSGAATGAAVGTALEPGMGTAVIGAAGAVAGAAVGVSAGVGWEVLIAHDSPGPVEQTARMLDQFNKNFSECIQKNVNHK